MADSDPGFGDRYDDLVAALATGDHARASRLIERMDALQPRPSALLDEFETAVRNGAYDRAESVLRKLSERYEERTVAESAAVERSGLARTRSRVREERQTLHQHVRTGAGIEIARAALLVDAATFLNDPESGDERALLDTVERVRERETAFRRTTERAAAVSEDVTVPPVVRVLSTTRDDSVGEAGVLRTVVGNVGDTPATGVAVTVTTPSGVTVEPDRATVESLPAEDDVTSEFPVTRAEPGSHRLTVQVTSENAGSSTDVRTIEVSGTDPGGSEGPLGVEGVPDWLVPVLGVGAVGAGAAGVAGYAAYRYASREDEAGDESGEPARPAAEQPDAGGGHEPAAGPGVTGWPEDHRAGSDGDASDRGAPDRDASDRGTTGPADAQLNFCRHCGEGLGEGAVSFCPACGKPVGRGDTG